MVFSYSWRRPAHLGTVRNREKVWALPLASSSNSIKQNASHRGRSLFTAKLVYDKTLLSAVRLYVLKKGALRLSPDAIVGFSFFNLPTGFISEWDLKGDVLTVGRKLPETARLFDPPGQDIARASFYKSGSPAYEEYFDGLVKDQVETSKKPERMKQAGSFEGELHTFPYTEQDIREGKAPLLEVDLLLLHARNQAELVQLYWSK